MRVTGLGRFANKNGYRASVIIEVMPCAEASKITKSSLKSMNYPKVYTFKVPLHEEATKIKIFYREMADNLLKQYLRIEMLQMVIRNYHSILTRSTKEIQNQRYFHNSTKKSSM